MTDLDYVAPQDLVGRCVLGKSGLEVITVHARRFDECPSLFLVDVSMPRPHVHPTNCHALWWSRTPGTAGRGSGGETRLSCVLQCVGLSVLAGTHDLSMPY